MDDSSEEFGLPKPGGQAEPPGPNPTHGAVDLTPQAAASLSSGVQTPTEGSSGSAQKAHTGPRSPHASQSPLASAQAPAEDSKASRSQSLASLGASAPSQAEQ
eukprot:scaffold207410_cov26-Prasinocladus_malaysianus.AAC.2